MLANLGEIGSFADPDVFAVLKRMGRNDPEPVIAAVAQENSLSRTGIPVPGVGYVGEMVKIA